MGGPTGMPHWGPRGMGPHGGPRGMDLKDIWASRTRGPGAWASRTRASRSQAPWGAQIASFYKLL